MGKAHRSGDYQRRSRLVRQAANADPSTKCWQCGMTQAEHGRPWTAGHVRDGDEGSPLLPECARCNYSRGATMGNRRRKIGVLKPTRQW